jgi:hypothetical protein
MPRSLATSRPGARGNRFRIENIVRGDDPGSDEFDGAFVVSPVELAEPEALGG